MSTIFEVELCPLSLTTAVTLTPCSPDTCTPWSIIYYFINSFTDSLAHTRTRIHKPTHSLTHSLTHSFIHSLTRTHTLTHSRTHSSRFSVPPMQPRRLLTSTVLSSRVNYDNFVFILNLTLLIWSCAEMVMQKFRRNMRAHLLSWRRVFICLGFQFGHSVLCAHTMHSDIQTRIRTHTHLHIHTTTLSHTCVKPIITSVTYSEPISCRVGRGGFSILPKRANRRHARGLR